MKNPNEQPWLAPLERATELVGTLAQYDDGRFHEAWSSLSKAEQEGAPMAHVALVGGLLVTTMRRRLKEECEAAACATTDAELAPLMASVQSLARLLGTVSGFEHLWTMKLVKQLTDGSTEPVVKVGKA